MTPLLKGGGGGAAQGIPFVHTSNIVLHDPNKNIRFPFAVQLSLTIKIVLGPLFPFFLQALQKRGLNRFVFDFICRFSNLDFFPLCFEKLEICCLRSQQKTQEFLKAGGWNLEWENTALFVT